MLSEENWSVGNCDQPIGSINVQVPVSPGTEIRGSMSTLIRQQLCGESKNCDCMVSDVLYAGLFIGCRELTFFCCIVWSARSERLEIGSGAPTQQPDGAGGFGILGQEKTNMIR